jgi:hypothetical protein
MWLRPKSIAIPGLVVIGISMLVVTAAADDGRPPLGGPG